MVKVGKTLYDQRSAGVLYSAAAAGMLFLSLIFSLVITAAGLMPDKDAPAPEWYLYCGYLVAPLAIGAVLALFFGFVDVRPRTVYRGTKPVYFLLAVLLQFGLFSISWVNGAVLSFLESAFGYVSPSSELPSLEGWNILPVLLVVALLPAVAEESLFRGAMLLSMKKFSLPVAVLLSGALFALYHQTPAQTVYQFCCGCVFALLAARSGSVFPTMLSHFLNNAVIIVLEACGMEDFSAVGGIVFYVLSSVSLAACLAYLVFIDKNGNEKKSESVSPFMFGAAAGIVVCALMWVSDFLLGTGVIS